MKNIYYFWKTLQEWRWNPGFVMQTRHPGNWQTLEGPDSSPLQEVWWPIPLNRHSCFPLVERCPECMIIWVAHRLQLNVFHWGWAAMLNHGYGVTTCRIYYHPTLCVSFRDAAGIVSQSRNSRLYWFLVTSISSGWCRSPNLGSQQPGNHTDVTVCQNVYKHT